jgi:hypothetical protein
VSIARAARLWGAALAAALLAAASGAEPAVPAQRYATTPFLEPDRCATAWVLSRFVDPAASFSFHERERLPANAEWFDLPEAELKRDARRSTLEVLIEREGLDDPLVLRLGRLIHDIEINSWSTRREAGSHEFEAILVETFREPSDPVEALRDCFELLDRFRDAGGDVSRWTTRNPD